MSRDEIYAHAAIALFAAFRADSKPTTPKEDTHRALWDASYITEAILKRSATQAEPGESTSSGTYRTSDPIKKYQESHK